jgi:1-acyl-sn-glycerol-3-phosphate acyltransferase
MKSCMDVLAAISPGLKLLLERFGKPEIINRPDFFRVDQTGAVIVCNHVGWFDSLWIAHAVYPRRLRYMSKQELFRSTLLRLVLHHGGSIPIDRANPSPSSIKAAVDILRHGGLILIFPSGTSKDETIAFKRGAATVAVHARVPLVPAFFQGPKRLQAGHLLRRPVVRVTFGSPIPTAAMAIGKQTTIELTRQLEAEVGKLRSMTEARPAAA